MSILAELIAFDTTSARSNLPLIDWLEDYLRPLGATTRRFPSPDATKANLWATFGPDPGGDLADGVILSGHTDVVPTATQSWASDPYILRRDDERLFGRGTSDMKGFIAVVLALLPEIQPSRLRAPLGLAFSYDEEVGIVGVRDMLHQLTAEGLRPAACLIGEPTGMDIIIGHKGKRAESVVVSGRAIHSALAPRGVNAICHAGDLIGFISSLQQRLADECAHDTDFEIPYPTVNIGPVRGGISVATVADQCAFDYEIRGGKGTDFERYIADVHNYAKAAVTPSMNRGEGPACGVSFSFHTDYPAFEIDRAHPLVQLASRLSPTSTVRKLSGGTEAGLFAAIADIPTVVVGPGSVEQAHQANEFVRVDQLSRCARFVADFLAASVFAEQNPLATRCPPPANAEVSRRP